MNRANWEAIIFSLFAWMQIILGLLNFTESITD